MFPSILSDPVAPAPAPQVTCTPGQDGIPDNLYGALVCGKWAIDAPAAGWHLARAHWPVLLAAILAVVALRIAVRMWRTRVWREHVTQARWLEITPPVSATPTATLGLWRLLTTLLPAPSRWTLRPARLVWEVQADPNGMRCGLWVPPGINPSAVLRIVQRGWPGARIEHTRAPRVSGIRAVAGAALHPTQPEWLPLVVDAQPHSMSARWDGARPEDDRLRAVFDGLAAAGRTGGGLLQVHVSRAPAHRVRTLRRATTDPSRAVRPRGAARVAVALMTGLRVVGIAVMDLARPGPTHQHTAARSTDPYLSDLARKARAKYADAPHLLVAVRATASGPTVAAAQAAAADITSGFGLLCAHLTRRRVRRPIPAATLRWVPEHRMTLVTVAEAAALAGLPAEPAAHGLPSAASRRRPVTRDVYTTTPLDAPPRTSRPARTAPPVAPGDDDEDTSTPWSTP